ncbi:MAG: hypothetical protein KGH99_02820 [Thaumarchaeota archaeon]|nr:hypothetical protein [Nitrososphaerota archaeon]MDE1872393.1 hypothetical protein [Nitrososphaerota archaeon]
MQRVDFLNKDNEKDIRIQSFRTKIPQKKHESIQTQSEENLSEREKQAAVADRSEFFTAFAYCQALIFKSWIEASDKLVKRMQAEKGQESSEIPSLYVDIHEEIFTTLFKSPEYASNLGRMINASMLVMKNWQILSKNNSDSKNDYSNKNKR